MGSERLPGKMLRKIGDETLIEIVLNRLLKFFPPYKIFVATSSKKENLKMVLLAESLKVQSFQGSENDVLSRFTEISKKIPSKYIVRLTGDSPVVDPKILLFGLQQIKENNYDYISTTLNKDYPVGIHIEIFKSSLIKNISSSQVDALSKEHVTPFIYNDRSKNLGNIKSNIKYPDGRFTIDYEKDLRFFKNIVKFSGKNLSDISPEDLLNLSKSRPDIFKINIDIKKERVITRS